METNKIFSIKDSVEYSSNSIVSKTIIKKETGNITLFAFDEGQSLSEHTAQFDAFVNVIDGEGEIIINKQVHKLLAGDSIIMPANIPHAVNADKKFKMLLVMIKEQIKLHNNASL